MVTCFGKNATKSQIILKNCQHLSRILDAIKYRQSLQENIDDDATRNIAMEMYINEEYRTGLNDYNHIISTHSDHLEQIHQQLDACPLSDCKIAERCNDNLRRRDNEEKCIDDNDNNDMNFRLKFYSELLDRIHFWLHHQFDIGMRIEKDVINQNQNDEFMVDEKAESANFDRHFAKLRTAVNQRRNKWKLQDSGTHQTEKYTLQFDKESYGSEFGGIQHTFIDAILQQMKQEKIELDIIESLYIFMTSEDYDSDALIADITQYEIG